MEVYAIMVDREYFTNTYIFQGGCYPATTKEPMKAKHYTSKGRAERGKEVLAGKLVNDYELEVTELRTITG